MVVRVRRAVWAAVLSSVALPSLASAALMNDPFTDGALIGGADPQGGAWIRRSGNETIGIVDDSAGLGTGNALNVTINTTQTERPIIGKYTAFSLGTGLGSYYSVSFDFRLGSVPAATNADGFRFGLYNSNGTATTSNGDGGSDNDFGYELSIGVKTSPGGDLFKEISNGNAGELGTGTDRTSVRTASLSTVAINDTLKHTANLTLTRTPTGILLSGSIDGNLVATGTDNSSPFTAFDEVMISHGPAFPYFIDNVVVDVPEPATAGVLTVGVAGLLLRRRRQA